MRVLIAEDDPISRGVLEATLVKWKYEVTTTRDGAEAWQILQTPDAPNLAILDWMMPQIDGVEICRRVRSMPFSRHIYLILLTGRGHREDLILGLQAGADDYITKPFDHEELRARVQAGSRIVELQAHLSMQVKKLEEALARVKQLQGLLPMCSYCKKIRDDGNYWQQVEAYLAKHTEAKLSHSICPSCYEQFLLPEIEKWETQSQREP